MMGEEGVPGWGEGTTMGEDSLMATLWDTVCGCLLDK